jgi:hypothetical protein
VAAAPYNAWVIAAMLLFSAGAAPAQAPSPDAMAAARSVVATLKLTDQYKALLPVILLNLKPTLVQDRPEIEQDYAAVQPQMEEAYRPYLNSMIDAAATVYASNFTVDELRKIDAFYRLPAGQKLLEKSPAFAQQATQIGQDISRKASDDLRGRLTELLRQKPKKP